MTHINQVSNIQQASPMKQKTIQSKAAVTPIKVDYNTEYQNNMIVEQVAEEDETFPHCS